MANGPESSPPPPSDRSSETPQEQWARIEESLKPQGHHTHVGYSERSDAAAAETAEGWARLEKAANFEKNQSAEEQIARDKTIEYFVERARELKTPPPPNSRDFVKTHEDYKNAETYIDAARTGNIFGSVTVLREGRERPVLLPSLYETLQKRLGELRANNGDENEIMRAEEAIGAIENWAKNQLQPGYDFVRIDPKSSADIYVVASKDGHERHLIAPKLGVSRGHPEREPRHQRGWNEDEWNETAKQFKFKLGDTIDLKDLSTDKRVRWTVGPARKDHEEIKYTITDSEGNSMEASQEEISDRHLKPLEPGQTWEITKADGTKGEWKLGRRREESDGKIVWDVVTPAGDRVRVAEDRIREGIGGKARLIWDRYMKMSAERSEKARTLPKDDASEEEKTLHLSDEEITREAKLHHLRPNSLRNAYLAGIPDPVKLLLAGRANSNLGESLRKMGMDTSAPEEYQPPSAEFYSNIFGKKGEERREMIEKITGQIVTAKGRRELRHMLEEPGAVPVLHRIPGANHVSGKIKRRIKARKVYNTERRQEDQQIAAETIKEVDKMDLSPREKGDEIVKRLGLNSYKRHYERGTFGMGLPGTRERLDHIERVEEHVAGIRSQLSRMNKHKLFNGTPTRLRDLAEEIIEAKEELDALKQNQSVLPDRYIISEAVKLRKAFDSSQDTAAIEAERVEFVDLRNKGAHTEEERRKFEELSRKHPEWLR